MLLCLLLYLILHHLLLVFYLVLYKMLNKHVNSRFCLSHQDKDWTTVCSGSLITRSYILTAAHCKPSMEDVERYVKIVNNI